MSMLIFIAFYNYPYLKSFLNHKIIIISYFKLMPIPTQEEQRKFQKRINFYAQKIGICRYRFYNLLQIRKKEIPRLFTNYHDEPVQQEVQTKLLDTADTYINCLRGEYYSRQIPEYLQAEANAFKRSFYTDLAPQFVLEEDRIPVMARIFEEGYAK